MEHVEGFDAKVHKYSQINKYKIFFCNTSEGQSLILKQTFSYFDSFKLSGMLGLLFTFGAPVIICHTVTVKPRAPKT